MPPSISSLPELINLVSVEESWFPELLLLLPELLLEEEELPPNLSCA